MVAPILVVATRNRGKSEEIRKFLADFSIEIKDLNDFGPIPEVEEDGQTFEWQTTEKSHRDQIASGQYCDLTG